MSDPLRSFRRMDEIPRQKTIAGESLALLEQAEKYVTGQLVDKAVRFRIDLPPPLRRPFTRALMRVEAELMLEYADACATDSHEPLPTWEGLHALAVATLLQRVAYGTDTPPSYASSPGSRSRRSDG